MNATMTRKTIRPAKPRTAPAGDGWRALAVTTIEQAHRPVLGSQGPERGRLRAVPDGRGRI